MKNSNKGKAKLISAPLLLVLLMAFAAVFAHSSFIAETPPAHNPSDSLPKTKKKKVEPDNQNYPLAAEGTQKKTLKTDTLPKRKDTSIVPAYDSLKNRINKRTGDTATTVVRTDTFDVKFSKDSLDAPVYYHADDSMVLDVPSNKITLYGKKSSTKYQDNELTAPGISFDQKTNEVTAYHQKDSTGKVIASPTFKQADMITVSDTIVYKMNSGKGITKGTYTQQGDIYIYGERIKKIDSSAFFAYRARFTTCNLDTPHFAFISKKIKFINKKFAVSGPVHPEFEGIPIPIVLPFGIYPMSQGRHSGLMAPAFTANAQFGLALENLGYYKVLSDNWDMTVRGTLYSYGGWTMQLAPRYMKRYRYSGNFNLNIQRLKVNFRGDPDFSLNRSFKINWQHSMDPKARPGVTFSANVDAGSSSFNQFVPNSPNLNFTNSMNSSISFAKVWKDRPYNISVTANHQQNTNTKFLSITLPDFGFNLNTLYPFRRKETVGTLKWYENIGIALNSNIRSTSSFSSDTSRSKLSATSQLNQNLQWGATHNVPINLSLPPIGPLQIAPSVSYSERWYQQKLEQTWNETTDKIDSSKSRGFYTARQMAFSLNFSTRIFGMFGFGKNSRIRAIRHEIRPTISMSYTPDMNRRFYRTVQVDTTGRKIRYSVFSTNTIAAPYGEGQFGGLSFGLDNIVQMKVKDKKDTSADATKKLTLLDGFNLQGSYNFLQDSFQLSTLTLSVRTNLLEKFNITANASFDPYNYDTVGNRVNRLIWKDKIFTLGRITGATLSLSSQFQGGDPKKKDEKKKRLTNQVNPLTGMPLSEEQAEAAFINNNPAQFADFSIPWSVNFGVSLRLGSFFDKIKRKYGYDVSTDVNFNGTVNLTPKWQIGLSGMYNLSTGQLGVLSMSISREMHCWQMSISVAPVGRFRFFNIVISPKSPLLRDLKINRMRNFFDL